MSNIRSFKEVKVWQRGMDATMEIFRCSGRFPDCERYSLTDQLRRSSRSVPANISEAWRKRRYPAAFVSKLNDSEGEAAETQTHVEIALRCGYLSPETARQLDATYEEILAMLVAMADRPEQWAIPGRKDAETRRGGDAEREGVGDPAAPISPSEKKKSAEKKQDAEMRKDPEPTISASPRLPLSASLPPASS